MCNGPFAASPPGARLSSRSRPSLREEAAKAEGAGRRRLLHRVQPYAREVGRCRHDDAGHGAPPGCQWHTVAERQRLCCPATHGPHRPRMIAARSSRRLQQETRGLRLVAVRLQGRCDGLAHEVRGLGVAALPFGPRVLVEVCPGDAEELILRAAAALAARGAEGAARAGGPGPARGGGGRPGGGGTEAPHAVGEHLDSLEKRRGPPGA
mmetsp:Transcript_17207/g.53174  ORF Transcript_17207/g.53174 Transcript_17207/m.53174 type:complete len:209 (+) Transcript_17207:98-724(+)